MEEINPKCFTKYLTDHNFVPHLQIPTEFLKNQVNNLSSNVFLVTDDDDGESSIVKIEKIGNDHFLTNGWKTIAEDLELQNGELLLFKLVEKSRFHLSVYGTNGCDKMLCSSDDDESGKDKQWIVKLTKNHESELELPEHLANVPGIRPFRKLDLVESKGRRKLGRVNVSKWHDKLYLAGGWNEFLVRHKIVVGSKVLLDFVQCSSSVIKFKLMDSKYDGEMFCSVKRKRGRPPILNKP